MNSILIMLIVNILPAALCIVFGIIYFDKLVRSKFFIDEDNRMIFYPYDTKTGYTATPEQIDECAKAFKKCYLFNVSGYKKDIKRIFANSEIIQTPMPTNIYQKNLAKQTRWTFLILALISGIGMRIWVELFGSRFTFFPIFMITFALIIIILKLKNK